MNSFTRRFESICSAENKPMFRSENINNEALLAAIIKASGSEKAWSMLRSVQGLWLGKKESG